MLRIVSLEDPDRDAAIDRLCRRAQAADPEVEASARRIIDAVRAGGDRALRELVEKFEGRRAESFEIDRAAWRAEAARVAPSVRAAIERAHARVRRFHDEEARRLAGCAFTITDEEGAELGLALTPLDRAGLYAPGGTARYPSSVLMTAVPARAAGVRELVLCCPGPSPEVLAAAEVAGVDRVFAVGGAQAVAAMAYGTESIPRVDIIVGPGNAYVAAAKRLVFGDVAIDQVAGPSEVLIVADGDADPRLLAADLLAQAEHDPLAWPVLVTTSRAVAEATGDELARQLPQLPRAKIAERAIEGQGAAVVARDLDEAIAIAERFAPEHLELHVAAADEVAKRVRCAGAIFVGPHTPEAAGDYLAGPNHVLPTGGSARFGAPLGVHDFLKRTSTLRYTEAALAAQTDDIVALAEVEGLAAHGRAVSLRRRR